MLVMKFIASTDSGRAIHFDFFIIGHLLTNYTGVAAAEGTGFPEANWILVQK